MAANTSIVPHFSGGLQPSVFQFGIHSIRTTIGDDGEPRFVAADVCSALGISDVSNAVSRLDEDEKGTHTVRTPGGTQRLLTINESGLYSLILTSRKPEAKAFKKWITSEVIPAIRKTGSYSSQKLTRTQALLEVVQQMVDLEQRQAEQEERIATLEANTNAQSEHYSILGYCRRYGLSMPSRNEAQSLGKSAAKLSRDLDYSVGKTNDPRYGEVGTYHKDILKQVFARRKSL